MILDTEHSAFFVVHRQLLATPDRVPGVGRGARLPRGVAVSAPSLRWCACAGGSRRAEPDPRPHADWCPVPTGHEYPKGLSNVSSIADLDERSFERRWEQCAGLVHRQRERDLVSAAVRHQFREPLRALRTAREQSRLFRNRR